MVRQTGGAVACPHCGFQNIIAAPSYPNHMGPQPAAPPPVTSPPSSSGVGTAVALLVGIAGFVWIVTTVPVLGFILGTIALGLSLTWAFSTKARPVITRVLQLTALPAWKRVVLCGIGLLGGVALFALANGMIGGLGRLVGFENLTLETILGVIFSPLMFVLGIPWQDCQTAGNLVGQKTILNEFVAYVNFAAVKDTLSTHTQAVITVALCGFANLTALAIMMGGVGSIVPSRKHEIAQLGLKAILVGTLSNLMSAALTSLLLAF